MFLQMLFSWLSCLYLDLFPFAARFDYILLRLINEASGLTMGKNTKSHVNGQERFKQKPCDPNMMGINKGRILLTEQEPNRVFTPPEVS